MLWPRLKQTTKLMVIPPPFKRTFGSFTLALLAASAALAQGAPPPPPLGAPPPPPPGVAQSAAPLLNAEALDQLVAPIALYPDPLLSQILMASTYPLEIVEASRWIQDPSNSQLRGDALASALDRQDWDPSVKSLVPFPNVLEMMDEHLDWTERLGDAFLAQQTEVMDAVQNLRRRAEASGTLRSSPQLSVEQSDGAVMIEPAQPDVVYVPNYDPRVAYGPWPYADYPPDFFGPSPGWGYASAGLAFGVGTVVLQPYWRWNNWDWRHHQITVDRDRWDRFRHDQNPAIRRQYIGRVEDAHPAPQGGTWQHDPDHRRTVPYRNDQVRQQFAPNQPAIAQPGTMGRPEAQHPSQFQPGAPAAPATPRQQFFQPAQPQPQPQPQSPPQQHYEMQRPIQPPAQPPRPVAPPHPQSAQPARPGQPEHEEHRPN